MLAVSSNISIRQDQIETANLAYASKASLANITPPIHLSPHVFFATFKHFQALIHLAGDGAKRGE